MYPWQLLVLSAFWLKLSQWIWCFIMALNCIFLIVNDVEQLFMCLVTLFLSLEFIEFLDEEINIFKWIKTFSAIIFLMFPYLSLPLVLPISVLVYLIAFIFCISVHFFLFSSFISSDCVISIHLPSRLITFSSISSNVVWSISHEFLMSAGRLFNSRISVSSATSLQIFLYLMWPYHYRLPDLFF